MKTSKLKDELMKSGASSEESGDLLDIAGKIGSIKTRGLSEKTKKVIADIPARNPREKKKISLVWLTSSIALASAVFVFVFVGHSLLKTPAPDTSSQGTQTHEAEKLEIDKMIEESKTELEALQQAEEPKPEDVEKAEEKYEEALDKLNRWKSEKKTEDKQENRERRRWRREDNDVRGTSNNKNQSSDTENKSQQYFPWLNQ